ncbi:hypothetical protein [Bacteroides sedimenti]
MKKQLLTVALMLIGIFAMAPSVDAKSTMDSNLTLLWMNTDVAPLELNARQGFGKNGKFYLQNKDTKKIEIWDGTGKISEIASGEGTNMTFDDAGNIIVRIGTFNTPYVATRNELRIIPADGSNVIDIPLSGITPGRLDFWGHVRGNVLDKVTGGILYMGTAWYPSLIEIPIIDGKQDVANTYTYSYTSPFGVSGNFATTMLASSWEGGEDLAILSPLFNKTNCNSIQKMSLDEDGNWVHNSYYVTPRHSGCAGFYIFKLGEQKYIVYPSGANNADGFTVSKLTTKAISDVEASDESVRVATKYSEQKDDGNTMYINNAFYGNHLSVEVVSDNEAYIYQYYPKGYIAKYSFKLTSTGIAGVETSKATVIGGIGEIKISGEASSIEVYTIGGALISKNQTVVKCAPGTYIVKADKNTTKVMVK